MIVWLLVAVAAIEAIVIRHLLRELHESWSNQNILLKRIRAFQSTVDELTKKDGP